MPQPFYTEKLESLIDHCGVINLEYCKTKCKIWSDKPNCPLMHVLDEIDRLYTKVV